MNQTDFPGILALHLHFSQDLVFDKEKVELIGFQGDFVFGERESFVIVVAIVGGLLKGFRQRIAYFGRFVVLSFLFWIEAMSINDIGRRFA